MNPNLNLSKNSRVKIFNIYFDRFSSLFYYFPKFNYYYSSPYIAEKWDEW